MTQVNSAQEARKKLASTPRARDRTLARRTADLEERIRSSLASDPVVALTDLPHVSARLKELRKLAGNPKQHEVALAIKAAPRTFQSWENGEVETDRENYATLARYYSRKLKRKVTTNWILFGQDEEPPLSTPDLAAALNGDRPADEGLHDQLDRIEKQQAETLTYLEGVQVSLATIAKMLSDEGPPKRRRRAS